MNSKAFHLFVDGSFNQDAQIMAAGCLLLEGRDVVAETSAHTTTLHNTQFGHEAYSIVLGMNLAYHRCEDNTKIHIYNDDEPLYHLLTRKLNNIETYKYFQTNKVFVKKILMMLDKFKERNIQILFHRYSDNQTLGLRRAHHLSRRYLSPIPNWTNQEFSRIKIEGQIKKKKKKTSQPNMKLN